MKRTFLFGLTAVIAFGSGSPGIRPRADAGEYPAHGSDGDATIAAAIIPSNEVKKIFATDLNKGGYIVIEVGVFPAAGKEVDLSPLDFTLLLDENSIAARPVDADAIAAVVGKKQEPAQTASSRDASVEVGASIEHGSYPDPSGRRTGGTMTGVSTGVGIGGPAPLGCRGINCEDQMPVPAPRGTASPSRGQMEQELWQKSLPDGKTTKDVAGYLYFPKPAGKTKNVAWELRWSNAGGRVKLALQNPAKR